MPCRAALILALLATPVLAEEPNLVPAPGDGSPDAAAGGAASRLILAQRAWEMAMVGGDPVPLIAAIRLARGVTPRAPTAWERTTTGPAPADEVEGRDAAADPGGPAALAIVQGLAGENPDLQDLVYDLDAQLPAGHAPTAIVAEASLGGGQVDSWRMPLFGAVPAELGLIGDGDTPLGLTVTDASGALVCALPPGHDPGLCRFTPARNGFFTVEIRNTGNLRNSYRLVGN